MTDRKVLYKWRACAGGGVDITVLPLVVIGLAFIRKVLEQSIDFNKTSSPVLTDGIPIRISSSP